MASTASASVRPVIPVSVEMAGMSKVNATSHNFTVKAMNSTDKTFYLVQSVTGVKGYVLAKIL